VSDIGINFDTVLSSLHNYSSRSEEAIDSTRIELSEYFVLLQKLAQLTGDETFRMSKRPLLPGAFHFALSQAILATTFEEALRIIAKSFNMLHGGNYNHVIFRDETMIYSIDNSGFPYPFELDEEQSDCLMECILVLMYTFFTLIVSERLDQYLLKVCTKRAHRNIHGIDNQLSFWHVGVCGNSPSYSLVYNCSAASLPITFNRKLLPEPDAIYELIAGTIRQRTALMPPETLIAAQVTSLLRLRFQTETEVAAEIGISKRTLRRRLLEGQTSFQILYNKRLNERARELLSSDHLVEEVAEELGYADERSFRRAFMRWNNLTPAQFRREG